MDYRYQDLSFVRRDRKKIVGRIYLPAEKGRYRTAIFAHGFNSEYGELEHYGPRFAKRGLAIVFFDFCGGGYGSRSDGDTTGMSVLTELEDYITVLRGIREYQEIDEEQIYLMGESQGGYEAALAAARYPEESAGAILWYPAFCLEENVRKWCQNGIPEHISLWGVPLGRIYSEDAIHTDIYAEIAEYHKQVLIIHGDQDDVVPLSCSHQAVEAYPSASLIVIPGGGHGFDGQQSVDAGNASMDFILKHTQ
ncbi:MAG: alpha/beta fold hydrolase [Lachnospiraceae bacterium]|nr:alpha/beta fold hydrolase [Lachnospiraceae bacterium]